MRLLKTENNDGAPARLRVLAGLSAGTEHAFVGEGEVSLGSGQGCALRFAHEDVSSLHAVVRALPGGRYEIVNRSLTGLLYVNGRRLVGSRALEGGESINVGGVAFVRFLGPSQPRREGADEPPADGAPTVEIAPSLAALVGERLAQPTPKTVPLRSLRLGDERAPEAEAPPPSRRHEALAAVRKVVLSVATAAAIGVVAGLQYRFVGPLARWASAARGASSVAAFEGPEGADQAPAGAVSAPSAPNAPVASGSTPSAPVAPAASPVARPAAASPEGARPAAASPEGARPAVAAPPEGARPAATSPEGARPAAAPLEAARPATATARPEAARPAAAGEPAGAARSASEPVGAARPAGEPAGAARSGATSPAPPAGARAARAADEISRAKLEARARRGVATQDELRLWLRLCQADNDTSCIAEAHLLLQRAQQEGR
ncbi:MAG TPA: FHA domain-containing protein [Polyangiaceae bacterium]|nr:FHA domain-containing protein [Polyangiaceae bacterium]